MVIFASLAASIAPASSHDHSPAAGLVSVGLGTTHFPASGAPRAQAEFVRGLLLLHSFEYDAARSAFRAAERIDQGFAMAYWGEALTYNHTLWGEQDLEAARAALAKFAETPEGRAARAGTARERGYLTAVEQLYGNGDKKQRDTNYSAALGALARAYPGDLDARALYALSILGLTDGKRNVANYMRAAAEAEAVCQIDKNHPGALHYVIHAYDDPIHAPLGLRAARLYGKVAPASSHAQHMPSHIFFALGMWDDAIEANVKSLKIARDQHDPGYHSLLWLIYAYLQENRRLEAEELVRSVARDVEAGSTKENRSRLAYARAIWLVETRGTGGRDARSTVDSSGIASIGYFAAHDFARGISAGANTAEARMALLQLQARIEAARGAIHGTAPARVDTVTAEDLEQAAIMATALDGTIRYYEGDRAGGIARVRDAVSAADHIEFEYGPPWSAKPLDELLGELLLADGQRNEAATAFENTLAVYPNRRLAREGLAACRSAGPQPGHTAGPTRQELIGTWQLLSIQLVGAHGPTIDPFYNTDSTGILIYDASGWMSVQIAGQPRPTMEVPGSRPTLNGVPEVAQLKAAVLDTYYAYYGTWEYDEATSKVTHHVESSLIPGEAGLSHSQTVTLSLD
ncbi:MAG TPA: lipocalin-like domain-containing protein [Steroidobacteraceae bacterium]|nr:lipocalin-like domain-containing protein [Steroidobacteraceae bacterium]